MSLLPRTNMQNAASPSIEAALLKEPADIAYLLKCVSPRVEPVKRTLKIGEILDCAIGRNVPTEAVRFLTALGQTWSLAAHPRIFDISTLLLEKYYRDDSLNALISLAKNVVVMRAEATKEFPVAVVFETPDQLDAFLVRMNAFEKQIRAAFEIRCNRSNISRHSLENAIRGKTKDCPLGVSILSVFGLPAEQEPIPVPDFPGIKKTGTNTPPPIQGGPR